MGEEKKARSPEPAGVEKNEGKGQEEEKLPLDARLLSEAVIELNISRRSVGLYPPGHVFITGAIERAFKLLGKLFELRKSIALGIAKDSLVIDEYSLDPGNPVYREVAESFHDKGIAGITFSSGLTQEELTSLHELLTMKDAPIGKEFSDLARDKGLTHIKLSPIDYSTFRFTERTREEGEKESNIWEDYVYGLLSGKLSSEEVSGTILKAAPEEIAELLNKAAQEQKSDESYDRVIASYMSSKGSSRLKGEAASKLFKLIDNLSPDLKNDFLSRSFEHISTDTSQAESIFSGMSREKLQETIEFMNKHASSVPTALKNIMNRLGSIQSERKFSFDILAGNTSVVHDIEIGSNLVGMFTEETFHRFVGDDYRKQLDKMIRNSAPRILLELEEVKEDCNEDIIDRITSEVMLEVLDTDIISAKDYLDVLTRLSEISEELVNTGRFEDVLNIYNTIYSHSMTGKYKHEAASTIVYFFQSSGFLERLQQAIMIWGRKDREGALRLSRALKGHLVSPLLDALSETDDPATRKFLMELLTGLGNDIMPEVIRRFSDKRWYVVRNMLILVRSCGDARHFIHIRKFVKHSDTRIALEAVRTLLHFKTSDSVPFLKFYLASGNEEARNQAIVLSGAYRVKEVVPTLLDILNKKDRLGTEANLKTMLVKALGEIGDKQAVPSLIRLFESSVLVNRKPMAELKREIFRNLLRYPPAAVKPILVKGQRSSDEFISSTSERMVKQLFIRERGY